MSAEQLTIRVRRLHPDRDADLPLPRYATDGAAGLDVCAAEGTTLWSGDIRTVRTGIAIEVPPGYEAQARPRSGLACLHGVTLYNAPGTIDSDYRGEVTVTLVNLGICAYTVRRGDRVCQLVIAPVVRAEVVEVAELSETARGAGGHGSTGR